jgi:hypothetical protein
MKRHELEARSLTDLLLPMMRYRVQRLGAGLSGAYNFYQARLEADRVFADYEIQLAGEIIERLGPIDHIYEIGCGWGQLVFLLAWCGYATTGFEIDTRRYNGARVLQGVLRQIDEDRGALAQVRHEAFPPLDAPELNRNLVISTNLVVGSPRLVEEHMMWGLRKYRYAIVDVDRFCRPRRPDERAAFIACLEQTGLRNAGLFYDAGAGGHFYAFEGDATIQAVREDDDV